MLNYVTINSINYCAATNTYWMEFADVRKVAKKLAKKCVEQHKRVWWNDFMNFYNINCQDDICHCANLSRKERKAYEKVCQIMGVKAKNIKYWNNNGHQAIRWAR